MTTSSISMALHGMTLCMLNSILDVQNELTMELFHAQS